jgi:hypothetical protein
MAAAGNGSAVCAELVPRLAKAVSVDYGQPEASSVHGGKTCGAVVSRLLEKARSDFSAPVEVTDVRVIGNEGSALLGFETAPAGYIAVKRENGTWGVAQLLPQRVIRCCR